MGSPANKKLERIFDANFNRAKEGLRVCEDISRFFYNRRVVTRKYKEARHRLANVLSTSEVVGFIHARDIVGDVGRRSSSSEMKRKDINDVFYANSQRVKESIRVLEEMAKLSNVKAAESLKRLRYRIYALEKEIIQKR